MRNLWVVVFALLLGLFSSCKSSKKATSPMPSFTPVLPYALLGKGLDTIFDYGVLQTSMNEVIPDSVFGRRAKGAIEFNVMIDSGKHVVDVNLIDCEFYESKNQLLYKYRINDNNKMGNRLKNYLIQFMKDKPFRQTKPVTLPKHATYCYINYH